jgi:nucleotide-binding universal stress UspA family protein
LILIQPMKTTKFKKVLIALDYDRSSKKIAELGFEIATAMNAEIVLLHVISEEPVYYSDYAYVHELQLDYTNNIEHLTQKFLEKAKTKLEDESISTVVKKGDIAKSILETAQELNIDLIVIGSHSRKWMANIIMGSKAEDVLKRTTIPLYIVPTNLQADPVHNGSL